MRWRNNPVAQGMSRKRNPQNLAPKKRNPWNPVPIKQNPQNSVTLLTAFVWLFLLTFFIFTDRIATKRQTVGIFYSETKNQHFCTTGATRCTDSCEIWHDGGACVSAWCTGMGMRPPKWRKFQLFGRGAPFDRFLQLLGVFIRPTTLH